MEQSIFYASTVVVFRRKIAEIRKTQNAEGNTIKSYAFVLRNCAYTCAVRADAYVFGENCTQILPPCGANIEGKHQHHQQQQQKQ